MKKLFFIAAIASAALVSCTKNEVAQVADQHQITFSTPVVGTATKAPVIGQIDGNKYPEAEKFSVYAMWSPDDLNSWAASENSIYMERVLCAKDGTNAFWVPDHTYYWPKNGKLSFAAYSPADAHSDSPYMGQGTFNYYATGLLIENFRVDADPAKHFDLMYSTRSLNRTESTEAIAVPDYDGVDLTFQHALSAIDFKVMTKADYVDATITLKSIKVLDALCVGNFNENLVADAEYTVAAGGSVWTPAAERCTDGYQALTADQVVTYNSGTAQTLASHNDIILLPQDLTAGTLADSPKIEVVYELKNYQNNTVTVKQTVNLADVDNDGTADYLKNGAADITAWEIGKRYTYVIIIGLDKIYFAPYVTEWDDVTVSDMFI